MSENKNERRKHANFRDNRKAYMGVICSAMCYLQRKGHEETSATKASLVGEVAHIVGERRDAARGNNSMSTAERNSHENLLLLCRKHHKIIDDDETTYTIEALHTLREEYLIWLSQSLDKAKPWSTPISQLTYINVPRLCELAKRQGRKVNLSKYKDGHSLHSLKWELNHVMAAFEGVLPQLSLSAIPFTEIQQPHEAYIGSTVAFERTLFRTKNVPYPSRESKELNWTFTGDLKIDPHIYCKKGTFKLVLTIDPRWITTSTAFTLFRPSSGQVTFSGIARITNVDYVEQTMTATSLIFGLPEAFFSESFSLGKATFSKSNPVASQDAELEKLCDHNKAKERGVYFTPSPESCDLCQTPLDDHQFMVDCGITHARAWACMCASCFFENGRGIGWGTGQLYKRDPQGWLLVAGFSPDSESDDY